MSFTIALTAFLLIFPIELPDKTFIATLVLATRYKPLMVWIGVAAAFLVLFVAEWGDLSQLLTAGLVVKYEDPVSVGVGAFLALATVSALAAVLGRTLLKWIRLATIRRVGGGVCLLLAVATLLQVANVSILA